MLCYIILYYTVSKYIRLFLYFYAIKRGFDTHHGIVIHPPLSAPGGVWRRVYEAFRVQASGLTGSASAYLGSGGDIFRFMFFAFRGREVHPSPPHPEF